MTKIEAFTRNEANRAALAAALPLVLEALEALKEGMESTAQVGKTMDPVIGNNFYQQSVGASYLIKGLPVLTEAPSEAKPLEGRRQFTEADRETLKQQKETN